MMMMMHYWVWYLVVVWMLTINIVSVVSANEETITIDWFIPIAEDSLAPITAHVGDTLEFIWSGLHNVNLHPSGTCNDRTNSIQIGSISGTTFTLMESHIGTHFFACQIGPHCDLGMHLTVTVNAKDDDDDDDGVVSCVIPPKEDDEVTTENGLRIFSGLLLFKYIGRPPVPKQDLKTMEQVIKDVYQMMTGTCTQPGVIRELQTIEIIQLFSTLDNDDEMNWATTGGGNHHTNHTSSQVVTQPITLIARLSGICNGCKLGESLFANDDDDDDDVSGRHYRRILEGIEQQYQFQIMTLNRNQKDTTALRGGRDVISIVRNNYKEEDGTWKKTPQRSLQGDDDDDDDDFCYCPGPTLNSFEESLKNEVFDLAEIGELTNIDEIEASIVLEEQHQNCSSTNIELFCTSTTIHIMEEQMICGIPNNHTNHTNITTTTGMSSSSSSSMFKNPKALKHFSTIYGTRYNKANLLNGESCDPYSRRIQSIEAYYNGLHKGMRHILQNDTEVPSGHEMTEGACHTITIRSIIRLEITAECIGCNGTLFDDEEENGESMNGTRHLRRLQVYNENKEAHEEDEVHEHEEMEEMDWYPFCFCPVNSTQQGLTVSHFRDVLNDALHIIQLEHGMSWRLEDMGNMESINCTSSETTLSPTHASTTATTSAPVPVETGSPTSTTTDPPLTSPPTPEPVVTPAPTSSPTKSNPACLDDGATVDLNVVNTGLYCESCTELQTLELECGGPGQTNYECSCIDLTITLWDDECNVQARDIEDVYAELCSTPEPTDAPTTPEPTDAPTTPVPTDAPTPEPTAAPTTPEPTAAPTTPEPTDAPTTPEPTDAPTTPEPTDAPTQAPTRSNPACDENGEDIVPDVDNTRVYCEGCSQLQTLELECGRPGQDKYECDCMLNVIDLWDSDCVDEPVAIEEAWEKQCTNPGCLANGVDINKDADNGFYCDDACTFTQIALLKCGSFNQNLFNCFCFLQLENDEELTVCGYTLDDVDPAELPDEAVALIDYCTTTFGP